MRPRQVRSGSAICVIVDARPHLCIPIRYIMTKMGGQECSGHECRCGDGAGNPVPSDLGTTQDAQMKQTCLQA